MYAQVTHTGNVVFIDEAEEVFYPCRCRQIKGEPPCCPVAYPSLGFIHKRHSPDVVELGEGKGFWCKFSSLKMPAGHKRGDNFPFNWCHKTGWVENVKPKSFSNRSNIGEPHSLILHPAVIDETKLRGFN